MFLEANNKWKSTNTAVCILSPKINASLKPHIKPSVKVWVNDLLCFCWSWSAHLSFLYRHTCLVLKKKTITYYVMVNLHCIFPKSQSFKSKLWESTHLIISYRIYVVLRGCAPWPLDFPKHPPTFPQKNALHVSGALLRQATALESSLAAAHAPHRADGSLETYKKLIEPISAW